MSHSRSLSKQTEGTHQFDPLKLIQQPPKPLLLFITPKDSPHTLSAKTQDIPTSEPKMRRCKKVLVRDGAAEDTYIIGLPDVSTNKPIVPIEKNGRRSNKGTHTKNNGTPPILPFPWRG